MRRIVVHAEFDSGTLSAPAFLDLTVRNEEGDTEVLNFMGKQARRLAYLQPGELFPENA